MKQRKTSTVILSLLMCVLFCGCNVPEADHSSSDAPQHVHVHTLRKYEEKKATCTTNGYISYYFCTDCKSYFLDANAEQQVTRQDITIDKFMHPNMQYNAGITANVNNGGQKEHWYCPDCERYYLDEMANVQVEGETVIVPAGTYTPDFVVEIPKGRDPVVLQLTDTQIIDGEQSRSTQSSGDVIRYATHKIPQYCYDYVEETIDSVNPDLIIITGDLIYGKYDDNGSALQAFIAFMETFQIPWAPVFGNHDNESNMGADWQSQQLEAAEYCMFKQRQLTGNGNYTVALKQGEQILRLFVMLDSNGCSDASAKSLANQHMRTGAGFGDDQIAWYTSEISTLKAYFPRAKISFAFHIQLAIFGEAFSKYGYNEKRTEQAIWVEAEENAAEGDFGYIGRAMKSAFDKDYAIFYSMKALGADSIFVGHEHCNSASVVYQGVRLQYGQKSSKYDRYNCVTSNNTIEAGYLYSEKGTPLLGGTVMTFAGVDGVMKDAYIFYCANAGGQLDWSKIII